MTTYHSGRPYVLRMVAFLLLSYVSLAHCAAGKVVSTRQIDWSTFLAQHDMYWTHITSDSEESPNHSAALKGGYSAGALMGNGLLGINLYKLRDDVYRFNVGRSDVTEARTPFGLFNSSRLPIGYFTLATQGHVIQEEMRLSLYDAQTRGTFTTDKGRLSFCTYVHANQNVIVLETKTEGAERDFQWDFVPQQARSSRSLPLHHRALPADYINHAGQSNPEPERMDQDGVHLLIQPLASDTTFTHIVRSYVVAWLIKDSRDGKRIFATVTQDTDRDRAIEESKELLKKAAASSPKSLSRTHLAWWHRFYQDAAFLSFPDARFESFYWAQYYKFASTGRPGCPVVDLQGVWTSWLTPWPAIWANLNLQLTYSWQTKANLGWLAQPLWETLYTHRDNLTRNVTDIRGQEDWTDAACLPRCATYDFHAPLDPILANYNNYEVGNLAWTLHYYWLQCRAYGNRQEMRDRLFPLLKSAVNLFFHIRQVDDQGRYTLPPTASPEYASGNIGPNSSYDLANLRQGLTTLLEIDSICGIHDPMVPKWQDFLSRLIDFPYSPETGFKVSQTTEFLNTSHRHYSHLFMIYPYHLLSWDDAYQRQQMELSIGRWKGDQGYSRTGKAAMLASQGKGDEALAEMSHFLHSFLKPNTLYAESGPVIETPFAAVSTLHEFYMQDWGGRIRVFHGIPSAWQDASFIRMRAQDAFLVSASRRDGRTVFVQVESEQGGTCHIQTDIPVDQLVVCHPNGKAKDFTVQERQSGHISFETETGETVWLRHRDSSGVYPQPLQHQASEAMPYGDGERMGK